MSQETVARKVRCTQGMISHILIGRKPPGHKLAVRLARRYGKTAEWWKAATPDQRRRLLKDDL